MEKRYTIPDVRRIFSLTIFVPFPSSSLLRLYLTISQYTFVLATLLFFSLLLWTTLLAPLAPLPLLFLLHLLLSST